MKEDLYINLIYKKLSGELSAAEGKDLDRWLEEAKENRETFESISVAWTVSADLKPNISVDLDQEFAVLDQRISADEKSDQESTQVKSLNPTARKSSNATLWRIAAGLIFLVAGYFFTQNALGAKAQLVEVKSMDAIKQLTLPDGSQVSLNKNSSVSYDKKFSGQERVVFLNGEAFFDVQHNPERPFLVKFNEQVVEVVGTSFNIKSNADQSTVALVSGEVNWSDKSSKKAFKLLPGMVVTKNLTSGMVELKKDAGYNFDYWQDQQINFEEMPLKNVMMDLERIFDIQISDLPANLSDCRFTSSFENASLATILETLSTVFGIEITRINSKTYQLKGGDCQ